MSEDNQKYNWCMVIILKNCKLDGYDKSMIITQFEISVHPWNTDLAALLLDHVGQHGLCK